MNKIVLLTCKLFDGDAYYFSKPIINIKEVSKLKIFRDKIGISDTKIEYHNVRFKGIIKYFERIINMLFQSRKSSLIVGIYEIPHGFIAMLIGKILRKKTVVCIISNPAYKEIRHGIRLKFSYFIFRNVDIITTTGTQSKKFMIKEGFNENKIRILPNSIDVNEFKPIECEKKYDIITIGRISEEKQVDLFIKIISLLKLNHPNIKVAIGGKGPDFEKINLLIKELDLINNVELLGFIPSDDLVNFLNSGKIFLSCSKTEGLPRTVIQSIACGLPNVSSNVGDLSDLIINEFNGFLINEISKPELYADKLDLLLTNQSMHDIFSANGLLHVKKHYDHSAAEEVWNNIFKTI